jgi:hypothetical protein
MSARKRFDIAAALKAANKCGPDAYESIHGAMIVNNLHDSEDFDVFADCASLIAQQAKTPAQLARMREQLHALLDNVLSWHVEEQKAARS